MGSCLKSFAIVGLGALLSGSGAAAVQDNATAPSGVLAAAQSSPVEFAMALANGAVPAGLEVRESDDVVPSNWPTVNDRRPPWFNADRTKRVAVTEVVRAFNESRRDYHAALMGQVIVIRPIDGTLQLLDQASGISGRTQVAGSMAAATRVFSAMIPELSGPLLNSIGHKSDAVQVVFGDGMRRVIDDLNQISLQTPPRTWVVTTRKRGDEVVLSAYGFIEADGSRRTQRLRR